MNSNGYSSSIPDSNSLSSSTLQSLIAKTTFKQQEQQKKGLTEKLRQTINAAGKFVQGTRREKISAPDLSNLTEKSQEIILRAVDTIKKEDSENIMIALNESRNILKNILEEFKIEQDEYREQLKGISRNKKAAIYRRKENSIPLSIFMRQKRDIDGLADLRPNSSMNPTYQVYFEALLTPNQNLQQHSSDKAAVIKYIRQRERRRRAEENRKNYELTGDVIKKQTAELIQKMEGIDVKFEHERQRQNDLLRIKMNEKKLKTQNIIEANEIIDQANEANLVRQRVEQTQREKIEARLSTARRQQNSTPTTNMIHVQSRLNDNDNENFQLNDEQIETTKNSIQLLNENENYKSIRSTTPIYANDNSNETLSNIYI